MSVWWGTGTRTLASLALLLLTVDWGVACCSSCCAVRMVIAGYPLPHGKLGLVVLCPLDPTPGVVEWLQQRGDVNFVVAPNKVRACLTTPKQQQQQ